MKKSNTSERLRHLMNLKNMRQVDILDKVKKSGGNISKSALSQYISGISEPNQEKLSMLSKALGVTETWLMGYNNEILPDPSKLVWEKGLEYIDLSRYIQIPVVGIIPAGFAIEAIEDIIDYTSIPAEWATSGQYIGLRVRGDSMYPILLDGDTVTIRLQPTAETGEICACYVNGFDSTLKRIEITESSITLKPENPNYPPTTYSHPGEVTIVGKVVEVIRKL